MGDFGPLAVKFPGEDVAVYEVIGAPPSEDGGVNTTAACVSPPNARMMAGAPGTAPGLTLFEGADEGPVPSELVAVTVKVYAVPLARPATVMGEAAPLAVKPPGEAVTLYEVISEPPLEAGGVNVTVACPLPAVAMPIVGAPGTAPGVTFHAADAGPVPTMFVAFTEQL
jgi:hypothetical protein